VQRQQPTDAEAKEMMSSTGLALDRLANRSSDELVGEARRGDFAAFEELYRRYYPPVMRRLSHLAGPSGAVADMAQETFLQAYQGLQHFRGESPFVHWVMRIATNVARSHYRRSHRRLWRLWARPEQEERVPMSLAGVEESYPTLHAVHRALDRLSPPLREAVILFELEELSLAEMAATLQIPLHTAASRVRRGREQLRRVLERMGYAPMMAGTAVLCGGEPR
jgi:RNA polymerase sigma-70 factor, ECF subfamily